MAYRNSHLSFSRLSRFEQCPLSFKLHYIDQVPSNSSLQLVFGKAIHAVLERLVWNHVLEERLGPMSEEEAARLWQEAVIAEGLTGGLAPFQEGLEILKSFVRHQGALDPKDILAVEQEFSIPIGPFTVVGFIDRVDRLDNETIRIVDYKTNRQLFSRDDVDSSLQLALYELAARQIWPWAKNVKLSYHMLRHDLFQDTERNEPQLEAVRKYVETLGRIIEESRDFPARLNGFCPTCDHHEQCPAYQQALQGTRTFVCKNLGDLESVAREREEVARLAKILTSRKEELDRVLKEQLRDKDELIAGGMQYRLFNTTTLKFPLQRTVDVVSRAIDIAPQALQERVGAVDKKELDNLLGELSKALPRARVSLLKAELETIAEKTYSTRLWAKEAAT